MATIVLAHGIARFDILLASLGHGVYFNGIAKYLHDHGIEKVVETDVAFADSVDVRSAQLAAAIRDIDGEVHVIAHSMGGLDARHAIVKDKAVEQKVKSLTTIGTPHNGTPFADYGLAHSGGGGIDLFRRASWPSLEGFRDLTTEACRGFNDRERRAESINHVRYRVVSASEDLLTTVGPLKASFEIIALAGERENDGLVPVASQRWHGHGLKGKKVEVIPFPVPADHLNEVGWWDPAELARLRFPEGYTETIREFYLYLAQTAIG